MEFTAIHLQSQYEGYAKTPQLWKGKMLGLQQFEIEITPLSLFTASIPEKLRLGKRVERFVCHELRTQVDLEILKENIQIFEEKLTLGELDVLLLKQGKPYHIEVVFKFYVYDKTVGQSELEHWIGPNRKDSLVQKLYKLKEKQLPMLYREQTQPILKELGIYPQNISQRVLFKAQLFVPLSDLGKSFPEINTDCIVGYYMNFKEIEAYADCKFHIPNKADWLLEVNTDVHWLEFNSFKLHLKDLHINFNSPLCWLKHPNGVIDKCFVTWWE